MKIISRKHDIEHKIRRYTACVVKRKNLYAKTYKTETNF